MRHLTGIESSQLFPWDLPLGLASGSCADFLLDALLASLVPLLILFHLVLAPYSKVEESFNIQATHDVLAFGLPVRHVAGSLRARYDHLTFSGPVPRTFVGPLAVAGVSWPVVHLVEGVNRQILGEFLLRVVRTWF